MVYLDVRPAQTAQFSRRFLHHPEFRTQAQRLGKVLHVSEGGIVVWQIGADRPTQVVW